MIMNCASTFKFRSLVFNLILIVAEQFDLETLSLCEKRIHAGYKSTGICMNQKGAARQTCLHCAPAEMFGLMTVTAL